MTSIDQRHEVRENREGTVPDEHKYIFDQIQIIRSLVDHTPADVDQIISALQKLLVITQSHFQHEESIMIKNNFPGTLLHKRDHDYLVDGLRTFIRSIVDNSIHASPAIGDNLQSWLRHHIKRFDDAYLEFKS
jgi:hemerythrin-like metal-binding protein